jgi:hypothetical protein
MERIKQAIENAKKPGASRSGRSDISQVHSQYTKGSHKGHWYSMDTIKTVIAFVLILFSGWLWMRLDFMNRIELIASEYIHDGVEQARAEIKRRIQDDESFKKLILANLAHCQEAAENDKDSYLKLVQDSVRLKNETTKHTAHEKFIVSKAVADKAEKMLASAKAECQQIYDNQLQNGR